jgi:hypothetical protein
MHAIINSNVFQTFLSLIDVVMNTDVKLDFTENGLEVLQADFANVQQIKAVIPKKLFKEFDFVPGSFVVIDIDLYSVAIDRMKGDECRLEEEEGSLSLKVGSTKYSEPKLEVNDTRRATADIKLPTFPVTVTMSGSELVSANKAFELIQTKMKLAEITLSAKEDSLIGTVRETKDERGKEVIHEFKADVMALEDVSATFDLDYIVRTAKPLKRAESIKIQLKKDFPMIISSVIDGVEVRYLLAPRVEDD